MNSTYRKYQVILLMFVLFFISGCNDPQPPSENITNQGNNQPNQMSVYAQYSPAKIDILPLTEYIINPETHEGEINLFVSLLDVFSSQIKSPCVFRFELYQKVQRSSDPKGQRIKIWSDMDLVEPEINNQYWRNFLRAYEFDLSYELQNNQTYILEVTCICPNTRHLLAEFNLKTQTEN